MTLNLYNISDDFNRINKTLGSPSEFSGMVVGEVNVINPTIDIAGTVSGYNYADIPDFGRKYFIEEMRVIRTGITRITLRCDPLTSFADYVLSLPAIAKRVGTEENPDLFSPYIVDPRQEFKAYHTTRSYVVGDLDAAGLSPVFILATVST